MSRPGPAGLPKGKFDGLQDGPGALSLFEVPDEPGGMPVERPRAPRTVASGACPRCGAVRVGLVRAAGHLAWRTHKYARALGGSDVCRASEMRLCDAPALDVRTTTGAEPPQCDCVPKPRVIA